jgi:hypothetical protein
VGATDVGVGVGEPADLPDSFYEMDEAMARQSVAAYRRSAQLANVPLEAKSVREAEARRLLAQYPTTVVRVRFPDRRLLQGQFASTEPGMPKVAAPQKGQRRH